MTLIAQSVANAQDGSESRGIVLGSGATLGVWDAPRSFRQVRTLEAARQ